MKYVWERGTVIRDWLEQVREVRKSAAAVQDCVGIVVEVGDGR